MVFLSWLFGRKYKTFNGLRVYNWDNILKKYYNPTYTKVSECSYVALNHDFLYPKGIGSSLEFIIKNMVTDGINKSILHKCGFYGIRQAFISVDICRSDYGKFMSDMVCDIKFIGTEIITFELKINDAAYSVQFTNKSQLGDSDTIIMEGKDPNNPSNRAILIDLAH